MFNEIKVAQMAAFFIKKEGGQVPVLKLNKLLYLADRASMERVGFPMTFDCMVSMPHGPVLSITKDYIDGSFKSKGWDTWISDRADHMVSINNQKIERKDLDELSNSDIAVLESVWKQFGHMDRWQIRDYTHDHCPEWKDPNGSSFPIKFKDIFLALGKSSEEAEILESRIEEQKSLGHILFQ